MTLLFPFTLRFWVSAPMSTVARRLLQYGHHSNWFIVNPDGSPPADRDAEQLFAPDAWETGYSVIQILQAKEHDRDDCSVRLESPVRIRHNAKSETVGIAILYVINDEGDRRRVKMHVLPVAAQVLTYTKTLLDRFFEDFPEADRTMIYTPTAAPAWLRPELHAFGLWVQSKGGEVNLARKGKAATGQTVRRRGTSSATDAKSLRALRLYNEEELTQASIAERMHVSVETVKRWLRRARRLSGSQ